MLKQQTLRHKGRSREGARIEIAARHAATVANQRRSREGARIEIGILTPSRASSLVAPVRERGLKFAGTFAITPFRVVAPVRERGLKFLFALSLLMILVSLP